MDTDAKKIPFSFDQMMPRFVCREADALPPKERTIFVRKKVRAFDRLGRMYRWKNDPMAGSMQELAIDLARTIPDHELVAEMCWHMSLCWHRTIDEGESMDVALEGMQAAELAGSELWTLVCRSEALFDGLGGTYPRVCTPMDWAPEASSVPSVLSAMRSNIGRLETLHPDASWICRAYLACLLQWDGQELLARREWGLALGSARKAMSRFAVEEILSLERGGMWRESGE